MIIITLLLIFVFASFTLYVAMTYGVQKSISESWYHLNYRYERWMFTGFCHGLAVLMALYAVQGKFLYVLSGCFLAFVGVATDFRSQWRVAPTVHYIGATGSIVLGVAALAIHDQVYWTALPIIATFALLRKYEKKTWWIEVAAFISIVIAKLTTI